MKKHLIKTKQRLLTIFFLAIALISAANVNATSLLKESFNYNTGTFGSSSGTNGGWKSAASNITIASGSLSYSDYKTASLSTGNKVNITHAAAIQNTYKPLSELVISGDIFASFLFTANPGFPGFDVTGNQCLGGLLESTSGSTYRLGFFVTNGTTPGTNIKFGIGTSFASIKGSLSPDFVVGNTYLIVLRARQNVVGTIDSIWMYVDPDLSSGSLPSNYTVRAYGNESYFQGFGAWSFRSVNSGTFSVDFDELKVGTTWKDAPEEMYADGPQMMLKNGSTKDVTVAQGASANIVYALIGTTNNYNIAFTKDGNPVSPDFITDNQSGNELTLSITPSQSTLAGDYVYTITPSDDNTSGTPMTGTISVTGYSPPAPTFSTTSSTMQTVKANTAITNIVYTIGNATDATVSGLPLGVAGSYNNGTFTITGTPGVETTYPAVYNYTVTATPLAGYTGTALTTTGKITVRDPNSKNVAILYTSTDPTAITGTNKYYSELNKYYNVSLITASNSASDTAAIMTNLQTYDLVILHEAVNSSNLTAQRLGKYIGKFPILNTKAHMYSKTNWPSGSGQGGTAGTSISATVQDAYIAHPIFTGVTMTNNVVTMAGATGIIRWVTGASTTGLCLIANNSTNTSGSISILENNTAGGAKKYMLIALAAANEDLTADGLLVIKNACDYLISSDVFVAPKNTSAKILTMNIGGSAVSIDETAKTATVVLPQGTSLSSLAVTLTMSSGATLTAPLSLTAVDFTNPVTFTVQAEDNTISPVSYTVTANITSFINNVNLKTKVTVAGSSVVVSADTGSSVKIFSANGILLYQATTNSQQYELPIVLNDGLYLVIVNGNTHKILIK